MPVFAYSPEVKAKILEVVKTARGNGRGWDEALMLAKNEGYKGGRAGLQQLVSKASAPAKAAEPQAAAPKKRGRPKKIALTPAPAADATWESVQSAMQSVIDQAIADRVQAVLAPIVQAVSALNTAIAEAQATTKVRGS